MAARSKTVSKNGSQYGSINNDPEEAVSPSGRASTSKAAATPSDDAQSIPPPKSPPSAVVRNEPGTGWIGSAFLITSSTLGGGTVGLGSAIAKSGGAIALLAILVVAVLNKYSLDLLVALMAESHDPPAFTYESLGFVTFGEKGRLTVIFSNSLYSLGVLVASLKILQDNCSVAVSHLFYGYSYDSDGSKKNLEEIFSNEYLTTIFFATTCILPLRLFRDLGPLERFSEIKVIVLVLIVATVIYLYTTNDDEGEPNFVEHWLVVHHSALQSVGTFFFVFVAQYDVHLVYQAMKPSQKQHYEKASTLGTAMNTAIVLFMGYPVYMTFWEETSSSIFLLYPASKAVDLCRCFLCIVVVLTYPFAFLVVREELVALLYSDENSQYPCSDDLNSIFLPGSDRQLKLGYHIAFTVVLWCTTLVLALKASSLGAVLNLAGCATGTLMSCILPALFSYKMRGHTMLGTVLFLLGGSVGLVGTIYSILTLSTT